MPWIFCNQHEVPSSYVALAGGEVHPIAEARLSLILNDSNMLRLFGVAPDFPDRIPDQPEHSGRATVTRIRRGACNVYLPRIHLNS